VTVLPGETKTPYELFYGEKAPYSRHLRTFGEIGVAREINDIKSKLEDRGATCIFVGYAEQHPGDVYRMLCIKTRRLRLSRDILWLDKNYGDYFKLTAREIHRINNGEEIPVVDIVKSDDDDDDHDDDSRAGRKDNSNEEQDTNTNERQSIFDIVPTQGTRSGKSFKKNEEMAEISLIQEEMALMVEGNWNDPKTFQEAWWHPDPVERAGWRGGIRKEFHDMISRRVWRKTKKETVPENRRLIGHKWIFKKKKDGRYRARLCASRLQSNPRRRFYRRTQSRCE